MRAFLIASAAIFGCVGLGAAEESPSISIDALVRQALAENPELKFYEAEITAAQGERKSVSGWQNPEFSGELGGKHTVGDGLDASGVVWAVSVQQTFEWPGRVSLRKALANHDIKLAELGLRQFRSSLAAAVRQNAYALMTAQKREAAAAEVANRGEGLVSTLVQREPGGITPQLESRAIEAAVLQLKREEAEASKEAHTALLSLNQLRGRPLAESIRIKSSPLSFAKLPGVPELLKRAGTGNFDLQLRETELEQQGFRLRLTENETWPSITAGPVAEQEYAGDQETRAAIAVSLPLPLWNQNRGRTEAAAARHLQAQAVLSKAQREVERQIREQATAYELHRKEMERWSATIAEDLRSAAELADRHYRLGAVPLATYLEVQSSYLSALEAIYATQADALAARAELEYLTGSMLP